MEQYFYIGEDRRLVISLNKEGAGYSIIGQRKCFCTKEGSKFSTDNCDFCKKTSWMMCLVDSSHSTDICVKVNIHEPK